MNIIFRLKHLWHKWLLYKTKKENNLKEVDYEAYLKTIYKKKMGRELNLDNPVLYTEKIQWSKINDMDTRKTILADKFLVRKWVEEKIGAEYLIPLLGVWDSFEEIDFSSLPEAYVLKMNNAAYRNIIVNSNMKLDYELAKESFWYWSNSPFYYQSLELQYKDIPPKIICEKNIVPDGSDLPDYKFFCFNGTVFCLYTMENFTYNHSDAKCGFFDREYNLLPYRNSRFQVIEKQPEKPANYWKMIEIAELLAKDFSHVRVDLYNLDGKIYFGEMTFTSGSGYYHFEPEEFDRILGEQWDLCL